MKQGNFVVVLIVICFRFAYKKELNVRKFKLEDLARLNKTGEVYTEKSWYRFLKQRWSTNFDSLEKFYMKIKIRHNETGEFSMKYGWQAILTGQHF